MTAKSSDLEFMALWKQHGSAVKVAKATGITERSAHKRRVNIERRYGVVLDSATPGPVPRPRLSIPKDGFRAIQNGLTGRVIIGSDMHAWPGERSVAFGAMIELIKDMNPSMVIMAGDSFDGARISRHLPGGWADMPTVAEELDAVKERHSEIESVAPAKCPLIWTAGNHDSRYGARLAQQAPEYLGVHGFDIADHFPAWQFCWSVWLNEHTVVKHRNNQSVHAAYTNTLKSGKSIVTGHTHRLQSSMYADYNGLRWGIECGTLSEWGPGNDKYCYAEDNPMNWSQGFVVLTFAKNGMLLEPEFCRVINDVAYFRGDVVYTRSGLKAA